MASAYASSFEHVLAELARLDLLLRIQVGRARQVQPDGEPGLPAFFVADAEIDALLETAIGTPTWAAVPLPAPQQEAVQARLDEMAAEVAARTLESLRQGVHLRLVALAQLFGLTPFDVDVVLVCLAPEFDRRYERLFAYLLDDVTRRQPTVDLVLDLLCPDLESKVAARSRFGAGAPLVRHGLVELEDEPDERAPPSLLGRSLRLDGRVAGHLLDDEEIDGRLWSLAQLVTPEAGLEALVFPPAFTAQMGALVEHARTGGDDLVVYLQGGRGVGKGAAALACGHALGTELLVVDGARLADRPVDDLARLARLVYREARLQGAVLYWEGFDALLAEGRVAHLSVVLALLDAHPGPTFLGGEVGWEPDGALRDACFVRLEVPQPGYAERLRLWQAELPAPGVEVDLPALANQFRLSGGQIHAAAASARAAARIRTCPPAAALITQDDLQAACRRQSGRKLAELAEKIHPRYTWDDLVLPADRVAQLREIHDHVRYRAVVHDTWGFERRLALGKGLNVLFAGPPGTGKTMAADVLAHELGLDLYRIDLARVLSKYIGETEKNLARLFDEAETSNAILLFDEADALFGKRTQVRDAHDRYANVEVSYLLQRMDDYEGVVVLATNLRKNIDDAFVRRLHFTVEFPMPGVDDRRRIWAQIWPALVPLDAGLDQDLLAREVEVAGGAIRNIALAGAFLAAADGGVVTLDHLRHATHRELQKMGKLQPHETRA